MATLNDLQMQIFDKIVTGVSRSGRVRKKSSKLLDFQSPDEVEKKLKRSTTRSVVKHGGRGRPSLATLRARRMKESKNESEVTDNRDNELDDEEIDLDSNVSDDEDVLSPNMENSSGLTVAADSDDDGFGELVADLVGADNQNLEISSGNPESKVRQSLYMSENNNKRKDGRVERKDKGKARYTAYSLWAREIRRTSKIDLDFSNAAKRLSELWANVSNKEKNSWRRKAKMQATKAKAREKAGMQSINAISQGEKIQQLQTTSFINRPTTNRTRKLAEDKRKAKDTTSIDVSSTTKRQRNSPYKKHQNSTPNKSNSSALTNGKASPSGYGNGALNVSKGLNNTRTPLPGIEPIDAAAHLKLLGESLTIIGERLKEHDGQIAVSASLSVLLDSLLCSLGPLLCLTTRLPGLDKRTQLKNNLALTLDNIAYVMPGV
uniref:HMG box domain-containing protein n=1 Tax=Glossina brevipalpis TaxID=37001 RepID=A0A1A9WE14_9MUSC